MLVKTKVVDTDCPGAAIVSDAGLAVTLKAGLGDAPTPWERVALEPEVVRVAAIGSRNGERTLRERASDQLCAATRHTDDG